MSKKSPRETDAAWTAKAKKDGLVITMEEDGTMREMGGSKYGVFNHALVDEVIRTAWVVAGPGEKEAADRKVTGMVVAAMRAFEPKDEIEGMLAAQAVAMHLASMEVFRRAIIPEQGAETASKLRRDGTNMARAMADMLSALAKHRGQGQQKVVVEHVHVHAGGQAVVGAVTTGGALPLSGDAAPALTHDDVAMALNDAAIVDLATGGRVGSDGR
ncbi:hypothetical protein D3273_24660 [Lichenibacterium minor]|uniref:Uncharacterized protein n=1 Tax=Lichenibacterium minor TaxID=2316528 RepID=A0A4Q2U3I2_9HYPH|nr:hypothetical protein [Lichenibacterium minor]RYC29306.1 hypothetical protein D3273_24660 [Lichenibacterium minor]